CAFGLFAAKPSRGGAFGRDRVDVDANALPTPFGACRPSGDRWCRCWGLHGPGRGAAGIGGLRRRGHPEDGPSVPARSGDRRRSTESTLTAPTTVGPPGRCAGGYSSFFEPTMISSQEGTEARRPRPLRLGAGRSLPSAGTEVEDGWSAARRGVPVSLRSMVARRRRGRFCGAGVLAAGGAGSMSGRPIGPFAVPVG